MKQFKDFLMESAVTLDQVASVIRKEVSGHTKEYSHDGNSVGFQATSQYKIAPLINKLIKVPGLYGSRKVWGASISGYKTWILQSNETSSKLEVVFQSKDGLTLHNVSVTNFKSMD